MVAIGEKSKKLEQLRSDASRKTKQIKRLENQLETLKEDISKLEKSQLPIRVIAAIEDKHNPDSSVYSSDQTKRTAIFIFPELDQVKIRTVTFGPDVPFYDNEVDLTRFYDSGHNTLDTQIPYGESFYGNYRTVIDHAIADVMSRIARILRKNENIDDWDLVGKLLVASYYNL